VIARASAKGESPLYTAPARAAARLRRALASGFVTLLAGKKGKHPAKALPPSITAIYPVCHAACKKKQASRQPERKHAKQAGWAETSFGKAPSIRFGPTPLLAEEQQGRSTAPAA